MLSIRLARHLSYEYAVYSSLSFSMLTDLGFVLHHHSQCFDLPYVFPIAPKVYGPCMHIINKTLHHPSPKNIAGYTHFHHRSVLPGWARGRTPTLYRNPYFFYGDIHV